MPDYRHNLEALRALASPCRLCPHECGVDRPAGEKGKCGVGRRAVVASYGPHYGEERPLVGSGGSGTIFFSGCNLSCLFCQNHDISQSVTGTAVEPARLAEIMLALEAGGCHNINWVSPTHVTWPAVEALALAREQGLAVPLVYNCGGYESCETLAALEGLVDVYMPDFKYGAGTGGEDYSRAPGYPETARAALKEMYRQVGDFVTDAQGVAVRGLLVRHLVLPGGLAHSREALEFLARECSTKVFLNVMDQYRPCFLAHRRPPLDRRPTRTEYIEVVRMARELGFGV